MGTLKEQLAKELNSSLSTCSHKMKFFKILRLEVASKDWLIYFVLVSRKPQLPSQQQQQQQQHS